MLLPISHLPFARLAPCPAAFMRTRLAPLWRASASRTRPVPASAAWSPFTIPARRSDSDFSPETLEIAK